MGWGGPPEPPLVLTIRESAAEPPPVGNCGILSLGSGRGSHQRWFSEHRPGAADIPSESHTHAPLVLPKRTPHQLATPQQRLQAGEAITATPPPPPLRSPPNAPRLSPRLMVRATRGAGRPRDTGRWGPPPHPAVLNFFPQNELKFQNGQICKARDDQPSNGTNRGTYP